IGARLRDAEGDMSAAGMTHEVDRYWRELLEKRNHVRDVLRHSIVVTDAIPMLGEKCRRLTAITRCFFDNGPRTAYQVRKSPSVPCTHTNGGFPASPWPTSR